jgi:hypothetical protein
MVMEAKMKKIVIASSIIGALVIVTTAIIFRSKRKKLEAKIKAGNTDVTIPASRTISSVVFPIKYGSGTTIAEQNAVKVVQRYINAKQNEVWHVIPRIPLQEDGIFGPLTESALYGMAGVKQVSYSFYTQMQDYLNTPVAPSSDSSVIDPSMQKNNIFPF